MKVKNFIFAISVLLLALACGGHEHHPPDYREIADVQYHVEFGEGHYDLLIKDYDGDGHFKSSDLIEITEHDMEHIMHYFDVHDPYYLEGISFDKSRIYPEDDLQDIIDHDAEHSHTHYHTHIEFDL